MTAPRYPSLYQINTRVWLTELSRDLGRRATLDDIPDAELDRLARARVDFAFETTLSGLIYLHRLKRWKATRYRIEITYLRLSSAGLALRRIAARVRQGGHNVPRDDVLRRFTRSWTNFHQFYRPLANAWAVYDNSGETPRLLEQGP